MIPDSVLSLLEDKLGHPVLSQKKASGGSINRAAIVEMEKIGPCFLKWNTSADPKMFSTEVKGLRLLRSADTDLIVPEVVDQGIADGDIGYLALDYLKEGRPTYDSAVEFGRNLAALHNHHREQYGLDYDNFIGKLPQSNTWHTNWTEFFVEERIGPQVKMAVERGRLDPEVTTRFEKLYLRLAELFPGEPASLLHGDLWNGNYFFNTDKKAVIYDPAVYYGHREIEIAFTKLFGGFPAEFYEGYNEMYPLEPGFDKRKDVYNLYPLLVHTNLFGGHYARQVLSILRRFS